MSQEHISRVGGELFSDPGPDGTLARGFLRGTGLTRDDIADRPVIGIANTWSELNPCNGGLRDVAADVKRGIVAAGGLPLEFPTISLAEPFVRPTSLYLRNLMAMDVEEMIRASPIDGVMLLGGCDKTIPALLMGAFSAGKPALAVAAGPRPLSCWRGEPMTVENFWPIIDERRSGVLDDAGWREFESQVSCGVGTCNVMGTATTMAVITEVLGMSLPGSSLAGAGTEERSGIAERTGRLIVARALAGRSPADIVDASALHDAFRAVCAVGGSTNAVIHLLAFAGRLGIPLEASVLRELSETTPFLVDVRPSGEGFLHEVEADGGIPALMHQLGDLVDLDRLAGDDRPWRESVAPPRRDGGTIGSRAEPKGPVGAIGLVSGTLAPDGAVVKLSAASPDLLSHTGRAVVFDGVEDLRSRIDSPDLEVDASSVLVLRGVGPIGGSGMPEVGHLPIPARLLAEGVTDMVRVSDARMSGTASGTVILHVAPEAAVGGPLALVRDGDPIRFDAASNRIDLLVPDEELTRRRAELRIEPVPSRGYERLYRGHVQQADTGCDFDFLRADGVSAPGASRTPGRTEQTA